MARRKRRVAKRVKVPRTGPAKRGGRRSMDMGIGTAERKDYALGGRATRIAKAQKFKGTKFSR